MKLGECEVRIVVRKQTLNAKTQSPESPQLRL